METVAFYSYKGGVGRSLLLTYGARFLAKLGKGVVALDFDFEAPGLHYKLGVARDADLSRLGGAVPYLNAAAEGAAVPPPLEAHLISIAVPPGTNGWLRLMPAGPAPHQKYWTAFKELGEKLRFGDPSGRGFMALLDLQARIADELKPDYLLIDARTGVTELGGLAATLLADTVVCMFVGNQESLDGTLMVVEALKAAPRLATQKPIRVVPVLSRTQVRTYTEQFTRVVKRLLELGEGKSLGKTDRALFVLPEDLGLYIWEHAFLNVWPIDKAYLELFQSLFPSVAGQVRRLPASLDRPAGPGGRSLPRRASKREKGG